MATVETEIETRRAPTGEPVGRTAYYGTGRRKTAVARVRVFEGSGKVRVEDRDLEEFFTEERDRALVLAPLRDTDLLGKVDCFVRVDGGGISGQSGAIRLGIARALKEMNPELDQRLREGGHLTRDPRMKERKNYGHKGARKSFQFSKR